MSSVTDLSRLSPLGDGRFCVHGTAVAIGQLAVLLLGPPGSGKSGLAAQLIVQNAALISDDLVVLAASDIGPLCSRPDDGPKAMELRGFGITPMLVTGNVPLGLVVDLASEGPRLPRDEVWSAPGGDVPLVRHPVSADLAAKIVLWMRSR